MIAKCSCQYCDGHIAFPSEAAGQMVECPHCHLETRLFIPPTIVPLTPAHLGKTQNIKLGLVVALVVVLIAIIASVVVYKKSANGFVDVQLSDNNPKSSMPVSIQTNEEYITVQKSRVSQAEALQKYIDESVQRVKDHYDSVEEVYYRKALETKKHFNHLKIMDAIEYGRSNLQLEVMKLNQDEEIRAMEAIHAAKEAEWQRKEDKWWDERKKPE